MAEPKVTPEDVKKVALLSKMDVSGQEEKFADLFTDTLKKIQDLNEVDTKSTKETFQVTGLKNVFQSKDFPDKNLSKEEALSNGKEVARGLFVTKGVFYKEPDES
jgi:aspartyl/glutamyl-tRNA(Asn/Gln) amidotransferase C subunit